jgi:outer membrane receptor protein involved in Fe transport
VYKHTNTAYKLIYGRAFRNPSTFERYWEPNPALTSERIETYEVAREQRLNRRVNLITSVFHYKLDGLIIGVPVTKTRLQYRNASNANATGVEMELSGQPTDWLETAASFSIERSRIDSSQRMQNSPVRLGQFRASVPLARQRLMLSGAVRYIGSRLDANALSVPAMTPVDVTATARHFRPGLELQLGVRNVLNQAFSDPLSPEHATSRMPDPGRSMFVKLTWRYD